MLFFTSGRLFPLFWGGSALFSGSRDIDFWQVPDSQKVAGFFLGGKNTGWLAGGGFVWVETGGMVGFRFTPR